MAPLSYMAMLACPVVGALGTAGIDIDSLDSSICPNDGPTGHAGSSLLRKSVQDKGRPPLPPYWHRVPFSAPADFDDLGAGCCDDALPKEHMMFDGNLGSLEQCAQKCREVGCRYITHGWKKGTKEASSWCTVIHPNATQHCRSLGSGAGDCGKRGGDNGVHTFQSMQRPLEFVDIGAGCCGDAPDENHLLFDGELGDLQACKEKCLEFGHSCGSISHGWKNEKSWCRVVHSWWTDRCSPLASGPGDCGTFGGDTGVHTYRLQDARIEPGTKYVPLDMPGQGKTDETHGAWAQGPSVCRARCQATAGCKHFTWFPPYSCHLQDSDATAVKDPQAIAGPPSVESHFPRWVLGKLSGTCDDACAEVGGKCDADAQSDLSDVDSTAAAAWKAGFQCTFLALDPPYPGDMPGVAAPYVQGRDDVRGFRNYGECGFYPKGTKARCDKYEGPEPNKDWGYPGFMAPNQWRPLCRCTQ